MTRPVLASPPFQEGGHFAFVHRSAQLALVGQPDVENVPGGQFGCAQRLVGSDREQLVEGSAEPPVMSLSNPPAVSQSNRFCRLIRCVV